ncbi:hypothetical protein AGLY_010837 [Aphis glycines]|uniref:Uncharacterized protein n=1 Tax=Aphis glycines TaxID=307491 RepID=A0A6G0TFL1_APHGL|nr:hypothetical protein AGLY_010837 [Aphis glycines]
MVFYFLKIVRQDPRSSLLGSINKNRKLVPVISMYYLKPFMSWVIMTQEPYNNDVFCIGNILFIFLNYIFLLYFLIEAYLNSKLGFRLLNIINNFITVSLNKYSFDSYKLKDYNLNNNELCKYLFMMLYYLPGHFITSETKYFFLFNFFFFWKMLAKLKMIHRNVSLLGLKLSANAFKAFVNPHRVGNMTVN